MAYKIDSQTRFLFKIFKEKRSNAIISPVWKKTLIHEKERIRALEMRSPIIEAVLALEEQGLKEQIRAIPFYKDVLNKSDTEHYLLGKITLSDKVEYYSFIQNILDILKEERKKLKQIEKEEQELKKH